MICPVEIVDYESSLIAADWYEEQGNIHYAEALRMPPTKGFMTRGRQWTRVSFCVAGYGRQSISHSNSKHPIARNRSMVMSRLEKERAWSSSNEQALRTQGQRRR